MSLTLGSLKLISVFGRVFPSPFTSDLQNYRLCSNLSYRKTSYRLYRFLSIVIIQYILFPFALCYSLWVFLHWKTFTILNMDQAIIYASFDIISVIFSAFYHLLNTKHAEIEYLVNQRCKLVPEASNTEYLLKINIIGKLCKETISVNLVAFFVYSVACSVILFPLTFVVAPFAISFDPGQIFFGNSIFVKLFSGLIYGGFAVSLIIVILTFVLIAVIMMEGLWKYTSGLSSDASQRSARKFYHCFQRYLTTQILLTIKNNLFALVFVILTFCGILLTSCLAYIVFKLYGTISIFIYGASIWGTPIKFLIAIVMTHLGGLPCSNIKKYRQFWKMHLKRKEDLKILSSCRVVGISVGSYGIATSKLGLVICDDIINITVTLLLLNVV